MKTPARLAFICLLVGLGLGAVGILLREADPSEAGLACSGPGSAGVRDCSTPYRVVHYTIESAGQASKVEDEVQYVLAQSPPAVFNWPIYGPSREADKLSGRPLAANSGSRVGDTLPQVTEPSISTGPPSPVPPKQLILLQSRADLAGAGLITQHNAAQPLLTKPRGSLTRQVEQMAAAGPVLARLLAHEPAEATGEAAVLAIASQSEDRVAAELPAIRPASPCPTNSKASFELIPIEGVTADHPDFLHGDLSLNLRGYLAVRELAGLVDYNGPADPDAPQLAGLFAPNRLAPLQTVYRVNQWLWASNQCGGQAHGCPGSAIADWPVTLIGLATTAGEAIYSPGRRAEIYGGGYIALVLYAAERGITLGYTRRDSVAAGYVIHLENVCVDPNLLALYRAQHNAAGWRIGNRLPALRNQQALGLALGDELLVAVRDNGNFLDPRSRKDWWQGR